MSSKNSYLDDNGGRCERCDRPESAFEEQSTFPIALGGGMGVGTIWLCKKCSNERLPNSTYKPPEVDSLKLNEASYNLIVNALRK